MSETKHTPGPWQWVGNDLDQIGADYKSVLGTTVICGKFCYGATVEMTISEEDKKLIAAAPDMATALLFIVENVKLISAYRLVIEAALLKAGYPIPAPKVA